MEVNIMPKKKSANKDYITKRTVSDEEWIQAYYTIKFEIFDQPHLTKLLAHLVKYTDNDRNIDLRDENKADLLKRFGSCDKTIHRNIRTLCSKNFLVASPFKGRFKASESLLVKSDLEYPKVEFRYSMLAGKKDAELVEHGYICLKERKVSAKGGIANGKKD